MRYYMFNKPRGCITACFDERKKTVMDYIPEEEREGLFPVGRLDKDTEGFLILTDDGGFCFHVNNPEHRVEKTYVFWARGVLDAEKIALLEGGVSISQKKERLTAPAVVEKLGEATLRDIAHLLDEDMNKLRHTRRGDIPITKCRITITEGKKHQVKRMAKAVGMEIVYLERVAISGVALDETLPRGSFRPLRQEELEKIRQGDSLKLEEENTK